MRVARHLVDVTPLRRVPAYRRLWCAGVLSGLGGGLTTFAVALQVYTQTGSSAAVGGVALVTLGPTLVVGLLGGAVTDRHDRRRLILAGTTALCLVSFALFAQALVGAPLALVYALVAVQSALSALTTPAQRTIVPALLPPKLVPSGLALGQLSFQVAIVGGPALSGLVTSLGGLVACYLLDALSFLGALDAVRRLPPLPPTASPPAVGPGRRTRSSVVEGLRFARDHRVVGGALLSDLASTALAMPFAILPAVNAASFGGSPATLGVLGSSPAVGGVVAMAASGSVRHLRRPGAALLAAGAVWAVALVAFGLSRHIGIACVALAAAGAADTVAVVLRSSLVLLSTPDALRGRLSSLEYVVGVGGPELGNARGGLVASAFGTTVSAVSGGVGVLLALCAIAVFCPSLWRDHPRAPV